MANTLMTSCNQAVVTSEYRIRKLNRNHVVISQPSSQRGVLNWMLGKSLSSN